MNLEVHEKVYTMTNPPDNMELFFDRFAKRLVEHPPTTQGAQWRLEEIGPRNGYSTTFRLPQQAEKINLDSQITVSFDPYDGGGYEVNAAMFLSADGMVGFMLKLLKNIMKKLISKEMPPWIAQVIADVLQDTDKETSVIKSHPLGRFCTFCGAVMPDSDPGLRFCKNCGNEIAS